MFLAILLLWQQGPTAVPQVMGGWCRPAIVNVSGKVTVNCVGVDPRALHRLNAQLNQRDLELVEKVRQANEWAERYHELEKQLEESGEGHGLSRQVAEHLHQGELEKAGAVLDQILTKGEPRADDAAAHHYNLGLILEMQFRPVEALPHLEQAYRYRPDNLNYALEYARVLQGENHFAEAGNIYRSSLSRLREFAKQDPTRFPQIASTLNGLGAFYNRTQKLPEALEAYQEALAITVELARQDPATYQPSGVDTLNNLAAIFRRTQKFTEAEETYQRALVISIGLANDNPAT